MIGPSSILPDDEFHLTLHNFYFDRRQGIPAQPARHVVDARDADDHYPVDMPLVIFSPSIPANSAMKTSFLLPSANRLLFPVAACAVFTMLAPALAQPATGGEPPPVTAIDILLEPDATMLKHAAENNARLRKVYPESFALDEAHSPHITLLQCFIRTADLDKVYEAAGKVLADAKVNSMKLEAFKYYYAPADEKTGVAGICAKPTADIVKLQADIIAAAKPFMVETATVSAFAAPHPSPDLDKALIDYVSTFDPKMSGEHFNPHVSTGVAPKDYIEKMMAEPFDTFTFSPAGAAVYQLGPYGAAAKKLKTFDLTKP